MAVIYSRSFFFTSYSEGESLSIQKEVLIMEQLLETLAVELGQLGGYQIGVDFRLTCGENGLYVQILKRDGVDDRSVLKVINRYSKYKPNVNLITSELVAFMLYGEFELGAHIRSVGLERKGDVYLANSQLIYNDETIKIVDKIIDREPNAKYELSQVIGDKVLINVSNVDVSEAFKNI